MTVRRAGPSALIAACIWLAASAHPALAAGYDTPILYTARHMGMGGTAIGYVADPSGVFHNPAGLAAIAGASAILDISYLMGQGIANPGTDDQDIESEPVSAPFFLVGGGYRINDWITVGAALYPVASAGGSYKYDLLGSPVNDYTRLVFFEASPVAAFNLPYNLRLGVGYRASMATLERIKGPTEGPLQEGVFNLAMTGTNASGVRVGLQWQPMDSVQVGMVYRSETTTPIEADTSTAFYQLFGTTKSEIVLPAKLGFGLRMDYYALTVAYDAEYTFADAVTKQEFIAEPLADTTPIDGASIQPGTSQLAITNKADWRNSWTLRAGGEYRFMETWAARLGYVYDGQVSNEIYPSAFGTPPTPTNSYTVGAGYDGGDWQANLAYAYRNGAVDIGKETLATDCIPCGKAGHYELTLHGIYVDFSYEWGGGDRSDAAPVPTYGSEPALEPEAIEATPVEDAAADAGDPAAPEEADAPVEIDPAVPETDATPEG